MKLKKIVSGGQTGADRTGLECARELGLETGGWVPKGARTESGIDKSLFDFGLKETPGVDYQTRTKWNTRDSDITVWFGNIGSPGYWCTLNGCAINGKKLIINPTASQFKDLAMEYEVINVAGNRASTNLKVCDLVRNAFSIIHRDVVAEPE